MASQRTKRAIRAGLSVTAAAALLTSVPGPALALPLAYQQPPPPNSESEALAQYEKLTSQVEQVNEDLLAAKTDLDKKNAALAQATQDLAAAKAAQDQAAADEEAFRGQVDNLTSASFQGARFNKLSALLTGSSADDFLERASALGVLASDNEEALSKLTSAVNMAEDGRNKAADAQKRAADASAAAKALTDKVTKTRDDLNAQIEQVEDLYADLSGADKDALMGESDNSVYLGGPGVGGEAARQAMTQRGDMYLWGAEGPDRYDCSGLTLWAYGQVGISLPHSSRAQYGYGKSVPQGQWVAGDLLFYGSSAGSIHHVAMYIGDGLLVHASTSGTPVKVDDAPYGGGKDYLGARRIAG
ncbi:MAG: C40 family peptidase [Actinophytocola sp.]|uniref:C40 family peptidase n=1 Tax=Actinophytocola sp. TaxID=1872138 RepID=UPI003C740EAE